MNDLNPYSPPQTDSANPAAELERRDHQPGPAIPIAVGCLIGGIAALPLLIDENPLGSVGVLPGALFGGLYFRWRSRGWPVDPTARQRRIAYAGLTTFLLPFLAVLFFGIRGQGMMITLVASWLGLSIAAGILISGDRRSITKWISTGSATPVRRRVRR